MGLLLGLRRLRMAPLTVEAYVKLGFLLKLVDGAPEGDTKYGFFIKRPAFFLIYFAR